MISTMTVEHESNPNRRPSLYTAIMLARIVQQFRERIKAKVNTMSSAANQCSGGDGAQFKSYAQEHTMEARAKGYTQQNRVNRRGLVYGRKLGSADLLLDLDRQAGPGALTLRNAAANDRLFLEYSSRRFPCFKEIERASHVLDVTTLLLDRLQAAHDDQSLRQQAAANYKFMDDIDYEKYVANLQHILGSIQQVALEALIQRSLESLESECHHWDQYLEQQRRLHSGWCSEWPSGMRPLSTTWPWNIKPSLMVLWGVCWMFYTPPAENRQSREESWMSDGTWAPQFIDQGYGYAETGADNSTGNQDQLHAHLGSSQPGMHPVLGQTIGPMSSGDLIGPVLAGAPYSPVLDNRAVSTSQGMTQIQSHMTTGSVSPVPLSAKRVGNHSVVLSSSRRGAPAVKIGHPYIRRASAAIAASSASSDGQFATAISSTWAPHNQGTNPGFAVTPSHPDWSQPNSNHTSISARPSQSLYPQSTVSINPYVGSYGASSSGPPPHYYSPAYNSPGPLGGPFANIGLPFSMQGSQNYPSPHSAASDRASPLCPVNMSGNSPQIMQRETSPSDALSPPRRRDTSKQMNEEPPRNAQGQIYCNDPECANKNEIFARKCEWRKHRDKHLRPYICNQPECEKIPGFTYSGGLLRHEREVHRQHGGPKAPRFCPHKDCKRSTGQGFSRKENLNEHLRRVHRGHGIEKDDTPLAPIGSTHSPLMPSTDTNSSRKRRRDEESDDGDLIDYGTASRPELVNEIKRLKDELEQTRDRLSYVESLVTGNKPQGSRYKME